MAQEFWSITYVSQHGTPSSVTRYPTQQEAAERWLDLLGSATRRRAIQWAGLFYCGPAATDEPVCIAQHTRPTA
jgi:hypothetical protein